MTHPIDVLLVEPSRDDAHKTLSAIRRKAPNVSAVHLWSADDALELIFNQRPAKEPLVPRLVIVDLAAAGDPAREMLRRFAEETRTRAVPTVVFTANRTPSDILQSFLLGAKMNILKPSDPDEYGLQIEQLVAKWLVN